VRHVTDIIKTKDKDEEPAALAVRQSPQLVRVLPHKPISRQVQGVAALLFPAHCCRDIVIYIWTIAGHNLHISNDTMG